MLSNRRVKRKSRQSRETRRCCCSHHKRILGNYPNKKERYHICSVSTRKSFQTLEKGREIYETDKRI